MTFAYHIINAKLMFIIMLVFSLLIFEQISTLYLRVMYLVILTLIQPDNSYSLFLIQGQHKTQSLARFQAGLLGYVVN